MEDKVIYDYLYLLSSFWMPVVIESGGELVLYSSDGFPKACGGLL